MYIPHVSGARSLPPYKCSDGSTVWKFENADASLAREFFASLEKEGFSPVTESETDGSLFAAFSGEEQINALFAPADGTLSVSVSPGGLFPRYEKNEIPAGETVFYAFESDRMMIDCGMCLLFQCADKSFFVVDSGHYFQPNDNDRIYKFMRDRTPAEQKVKICGWLVTHAHSDHIAKLIDFLDYNMRDVEIDGFYHNLLPFDYPNDEWSVEERQLALKLDAKIKKSGVNCYTLHTGQRFYVSNLEINVLYTHEDAYPQVITDYNDSSAVVSVTVDGSRVLIPGDASRIASAVLEKRYTRALKCDVVQVSHHGHTGLSKHCYELTGAKTAVFPVTRIKFSEELPRQEANRYLTESAEQYFITADGTVGIPLPYKKESVFTLPGETFEDFAKIKRLWNYSYSDEFIKEQYDIFLAHGGNPDALTLPVCREGYIENGAW